MFESAFNDIFQLHLRYAGGTVSHTSILGTIYFNVLEIADSFACFESSEHPDRGFSMTVWNESKNQLVSKFDMGIFEDNDDLFNRFHEWCENLFNNILI